MSGPDIDDPDLPLRALFENWPATAAVFQSHRMLCFGCPITPFHTVADACLEYGLNEFSFRDELRQALTALPIQDEALNRPMHGTAGKTKRRER